jgi:mRNA interferase MazF
MNLQPGEVWLADLGLAAKTRPVVIVSRYDADPPRALAVYVPLTTQNRRSLYEVALPRLRFLTQDSVANVQGIGSIPTVRLERKLGKMPDEVMLKIKQAMLFTLDLEPDVEESDEVCKQQHEFSLRRL